MSGILVVAEDAATGAALASSLASVEREITVVDSCGQAREAANAMSSLDLAVLDWTLRDGTGLELVEVLRGGHPHVELIAIGAEEDAETTLKNAGLGIVDCVREPLADPQRLALVARNALARAGLRREHIRLLKDLRHSEQRYQLVLQATNEGIWDWDIDGRVVYYSPRWKEMLGIGDAEIGPGIDEWIGRVHPQDRELLQTSLDTHLRGDEPVFWCEYRIKHRDLGYRWCLARGMALRDAAGRAVRIAGTQSDITEKKWAMDQLLHDALHDRTTGLPNRTLLADRIEHAVASQTTIAAGRLALIALETEKFHLIQDALGNEAARQILYAIGERITETLGPSRTVANLGGERFAVLLEDIGHAGAADDMARQIRDSFKDPFEVLGREIFVSFSVGMAIPERGSGRTGDEIIRDAEIAMGQAKRQGAGTHVIFREEMHRRTVSLLDLDTRLRRALDRDEFVAYYQPIVATGSNSIVGFETLARWHTAEGEVLEPAAFLGRAMDNGLIVDIERRLFRSSCAQVARWGRGDATGRPLSLSVNVSADRLWHVDLLAEVVRAITDAGLRPEHLKLELLESIVMREPKKAVERIEELKRLGVQIGIDDFGTGYSSLSYLHHLPLDFVKIDKSFVAELEHDAKADALVRSIIALTANLRLSVIAEGVETSGQAEYLTQIGCDFMQGFLFGRPVPAHEVAGMLQRGAVAARCP